MIAPFCRRPGTGEARPAALVSAHRQAFCNSIISRAHGRNRPKCLAPASGRGALNEQEARALSTYLAEPDVPSWRCVRPFERPSASSPKTNGAGRRRRRRQEGEIWPKDWDRRLCVGRECGRVAGTGSLRAQANRQKAGRRELELGGLSKQNAHSSRSPSRLGGRAGGRARLIARSASTWAANKAAGDAIDFMSSQREPICIRFVLRSRLQGGRRPSWPTSHSAASPANFPLALTFNCPARPTGPLASQSGRWRDN